jgi:class 3 adenylate cyclase
VWLAVAERPWILGLAILLALVLLPVAVWLDLRNLSDTGLAVQARTLNAMVSEIRGYYGSRVVARVQGFDGDSLALHNYEDVEGAIPIPATLSLELGDVIAARGSGNIEYRFVSDETFANRAAHRLDAFERGALEQFRESRSADDIATQFSGSLFEREVRMAVPVVMGQACVSCHNSHPESPRRDWQVGDVRGIQAIAVHQPIAANLFSFKYLFMYFAGAGAFGIAFAGLQWRQANVFRSMNADLEEANSFLATISMKISKYLSPQIYKSIFSGEKDVVISTERKKLTIFFSDIKDFTETAEHLQPEELTALLNEYFTEMSAIAHAHGATVDKFIGDAILAFFGDPETRGAREDANACLDMAMAMQRRMGELKREWRRRGIEKPFEVRMGINTGYCNVGNFGSSDRMDYTIIGAEANLAARLQGIAEPGGIVISYETWAHVQERVRVHQLPPITLKGISGEIVPYAVDGLAGDDAGEGGEATILREEGEGLHLRLDLDRLDGDARRRARAALEKALEALRRGEGESASS